MTEAPFDLLIQGGRVLLAGLSDPVECDLGMRDGEVRAILAPRASASASEILDAAGLVVLPGVIDAHVHFGLGFSGDWDTESRTAALGGVTTVLSYIQDPASYNEFVPAEVERGRSASVIDFGLHCILMNERHLEELDAYIGDLGVTSFKYFTNFKGQEGAYMGVEGTDAGFFFALCRAIAEHPEAILAVHTENIEVVWRLARELRDAGRDNLAAWTASRPDFVEAHDMFTAFLFSEQTGARIYIPHLSSAAGLWVHREHRARGGSAVLETCPHYLTHTSASELGTLVKVNPPVRTDRDVQALWEAVRDSTISVVGSDHNSRRAERKQGSIWTASAGFPGVATLVGVLLSEGYHGRGLPLGRISQVLSEGPARVFGLYPRKGAIAIGSDADVTLIDLERVQAFDPSGLPSHSDYSIYAGWQLRGWPVATVVRGRVVAREGEVLAPSGWGRYLHRPLTDHRPVGKARVGAAHAGAAGG